MASIFFASGVAGEANRAPSSEGVMVNRRLASNDHTR